MKFVIFLHANCENAPHVGTTRTWKITETTQPDLLHLYVSRALLLHYMKLCAAVPKWLLLLFQLLGVRGKSKGRKYALLRMHID